MFKGPEDPALAEQDHLSKTLRKHSVITPLGHRIFDRGLKEMERRVSLAAQQAHVLREPRAAQALEVAEEAISEARKELAK